MAVEGTPDAAVVPAIDVHAVVTVLLSEIVVFHMLVFLLLLSSLFQCLIALLILNQKSFCFFVFVNTPKELEDEEYR